MKISTADKPRNQRYIREAAVIVAAVFGAYLYISLGSFSIDEDTRNLGGNLGDIIAYGLLYSFGYSAYLIIAFLIHAIWLYISLLQAGKQGQAILPSSLVGLLLLVICTCGLEALRLYGDNSVLPAQRSGGLIGYGVAKTLFDLLGFHGASMILLGLWISSLSLFAMFSWLTVCDWVGKLLGLSWIHIQPLLRRVARFLGGTALGSANSSRTTGRPRRPEISQRIRKASFEGPSLKKKPASAAGKPASKAPGKQKAAPGDYQTPTVDLLSVAVSKIQSMTKVELQQLAQTIETKLAEFGVQASVEKILPGPVVTRYEIQPATGVKGSQVVSLARDLSRALSVSSIRILETIPGKTTMGLEVPNAERQLVSLKELLNSSEYLTTSSPLSLALGRDIAGEVFIANLEDMPHLLVAGTTGAGKSVQINSMILSILFRAKPEEVRLILIDPKVVELAPFDGLPHLLSPVISDMELVPSVLTWCVAEMERRYHLMAKMGVRNLAGLNEVIAGNATDPDTGEKLRPLHLLVVVVDELADLMAVCGKKVEQLISRLAQKARAAGIHLILATQRPSVDVITGLIKANVPSRIAFQVSSKIDSRTILDQSGAESLLGKGDMLYLPGGQGQPTRIHGAFVTDEEVRNVTEHIRSLGIVTEKIDFTPSPGNGGMLNMGEQADDPMLAQAIELISANQRVSISLVQRHLRIGYNRAARMVESMERTGIVSAMDSGGNRKVIGGMDKIT